jgi:UDP-2,3-diacylglucosamine pyrophosphatase LpxH
VRIRVEHGHLYDPFFSQYPELYRIATRVAGAALFLTKDTYRVWTWLADHADRIRRSRAGDDLTAVSYCHAAADMLLRRGFDTVIFGHTHNAESVALPSGTYINCGNWLSGRTYVDIDHGQVRLCSWEPNGTPASN